MGSRAGRSAFGGSSATELQEKMSVFPAGAGFTAAGRSSHRTLPWQRSISRGSSSLTYPAQTLGSALLRFSEQAQLQVIVDSRLAESVSAPPLKGGVHARRCTENAPEGSGLMFRIVGTAAIAIHAAPRCTACIAMAAVPTMRNVRPEPSRSTFSASPRVYAPLRGGALTDSASRLSTIT